MSLILQNLCKSYPTRGGDLSVLRDINLTLQDGEALAILGPSGSGKSTLLYLLGTLERPTSGTYKLGAQEPFALTDRGLAHFRNRSIGFIFQDHHLLPQCSLLENVLIPVLAGGMANAETRARQLLERVGLSHRLEHRPAELSGGERQRVAVARALINNPGLVMLDEPTGNLDSHTAQGIKDLMLELSTQMRTAFLVVTHDMSMARQMDRVLHLQEGHLVAI